MYEGRTDANLDSRVLAIERSDSSNGRRSSGLLAKIASVLEVGMLDVLQKNTQRAFLVELRGETISTALSMSVGRLDST